MRTLMKRLLLGCLLVVPTTVYPHSDADSGAAMIGHPAPAWSFDRWARGGPLSLAELRGRVVLIRFWTERCSFCTNTLPALERARVAHADEGFVVLGAFHPQRAAQHRSDRRILALADSLGFQGPIAVDERWTTLARYWLTGHPERNWVSVSFLIGRDGNVRWVHGGGEYHPTDDPRHHRCDVQWKEFEHELAAALAAPAPASP